MAQYSTNLRDAVKRIGHGRTTNSHELERVGQGLFKRGWQGVVPRDMIPAAKQNSYLICNLDRSGKQKLFHWVCRYVDSDGEIAWHDPLGTAGIAQAQPLRQQLRGKQWTDDHNTRDASHQGDSQDNCGQRCLAALMIGQQSGMDNFLLL